MKKNVVIAILVGVLSLIIVIIGLNYLRFDMKSNNWNVYLDNMKTSIINGSVYVPESPEIEATNIKAYDVLISKRGDAASFTFDVVNDGDIDAKLSSLIKLEPKCISLELPAIESDEELVCNNLEYKLYYTKTNKEIKILDVIKAHYKENITIKVGLKENILEDPEGDVQVTLFDMTLVYN